MRVAKSLKLWLLAGTFLASPLALANAQQFKPAEQAAANPSAPPVPSAVDQTFAKLAPVQSAGDVMADVAEQQNAAARAKGADDEIYSTGLVELKIANPVDLAGMRDSLAQRAWLEAQSQLIVSIYSTFEASAVFDMPGNPLNNKFKDQRSALEGQINDIQKKLKDAAFDVDQADGLQVENEIDAADEIKLTDRANALIDGVIKKLDAEFSVQKLSQLKEDAMQKKAQALQQVSQESKSRLTNLQKQLDSLNENLKEEMSRINTSLTSSAERIASMPLLGATVVDSAESYIDGTYQVALVMKWSKKNEKFAQAILRGEALKDEPRPGHSLTDWLSKIDKGTMLGSRVFTDENGDRWYIGVGSSPIQGGGDMLTVAQSLASLSADRSLMFSLLANAASYESAKSVLATSTSASAHDGTNTVSLTRSLSAKIEKTAVANKKVLLSRKALNEVTGQEVWVDVIAVNATSSQRALDDLKRSFATAIDISRYQGSLQGNVQGMRDAQTDAAGQAKATRSEAAAQTRQQMQPEASTARAAPVSGGSAGAVGGLMDGAVITGRKAGGTRTGGGYADDQ
jgi:hypothetical protein